MMPTFPRSSLSFRTAGFPQYGWKAGFPGGAFPDCQRLKPAPGIRRPNIRFASALRAPRSHDGCPALCRAEDSIARRRGGSLLLRPRGPRSGPGYSVPVRHHLVGPIRPTRGHTAISPHGGLYAMPSLCGSAYSCLSKRALSVSRWGPSRAYLFPLRSGRDDHCWLIERRRSTALLLSASPARLLRLAA